MATFTVIDKMLDYIIAIRVIDLPIIIAYIAAMGLTAYCTALILVGFPGTVIAAISKKKLDKSKERKATLTVAVVLFVILILRLLYEAAI